MELRDRNPKPVPVGEGEGRDARARGPDESALLPRSSDRCLLSSGLSLEPERALSVP